MLVVELADFSVVLRARYWTLPGRADTLLAQDRVLTAIKAVLVQNGVDLPYPTQQILFHDQTEETDGDRRRQREGWPAGPGPGPDPAPRPRRTGQQAGKHTGQQDSNTGGA